MCVRTRGDMNLDLGVCAGEEGDEGRFEKCAGLGGLVRTGLETVWREEGWR